MAIPNRATNDHNAQLIEIYAVLGALVDNLNFMLGLTSDTFLRLYHGAVYVDAQEMRTSLQIRVGKTVQLNIVHKLDRGELSVEINALGDDSLPIQRLTWLQGTFQFAVDVMSGDIVESNFELLELGLQAITELLDRYAVHAGVKIQRRAELLMDAVATLPGSFTDKPYGVELHQRKDAIDLTACEDERDLLIRRSAGSTSVSYRTEDADWANAVIQKLRADLFFIHPE